MAGRPAQIAESQQRPVPGEILTGEDRPPCIPELESGKVDRWVHQDAFDCREYRIPMFELISPIIGDQKQPESSRFPAAGELKFFLCINCGRVMLVAQPE